MNKMNLTDITDITENEKIDIINSLKVFTRKVTADKHRVSSFSYIKENNKIKLETIITKNVYE